MSYIYDILFFLGEDERILEIRWKNPELRQCCASYWNTFTGKIWHSLPDLQIQTEDRLIYWKKKCFTYEKEEGQNGGSLLFLCQNPAAIHYYQEALQLLDEGVQIYDKDANVIYFNDITKKIVGIEDDVQGKNLLDIFDVTEKESTTMESLRLNAPVRNRFNHYRSKKGKELITVNTTLPIRRNGNLIGALTLEENVTVIERKAERLKKLKSAMEDRVTDASFFRPPNGYTFDSMIGHHPKITALKNLAKRVACQDSNILIVGETGTGKEILAQAIHNGSERKRKPFVALNCAAVPENLIESILFGTEKGSFTGSMNKLGLLEEANQGTLFLDELNSMSLVMQSKVLRSLQEGTFRRVGGNKEYKVNVRVISSCNEDPFVLMEQQKLRSDLFYRLATIVLELPPLRERPEDIEELLWHHIHSSESRYAFPFTEIDPAVLWQLQQYSWPGNIRELFHAADYAMNVATDTIFRTEYLPSYCFRKKEEDAANNTDSSKIPAATLREQMDDCEAEIIRRTLQYYGGNITKAARKLGLQRQGLQYRIRKYGIRL